MRRKLVHRQRQHLHSREPAQREINEIDRFNRKWSAAPIRAVARGRYLGRQMLLAQAARRVELNCTHAHTAQVHDFGRRNRTSVRNGCVLCSSCGNAA